MMIPRLQYAPGAIVIVYTQQIRREVVFEVRASQAGISQQLLCDADDCCFSHENCRALMECAILQAEGAKVLP